MFTGIIQSKGSIKEIFSSSDGARLKINTNALDLSDTKVGDSIAVDGVCLTVTELTESSFTADVSNETLTCTTFSALKQGKTLTLKDHSELIKALMVT